ncbi:MAG: DUF2442 domain-containing protein [Planctomycetaceae bacterium]|jgi:hypothetical protein|nr:DUF2442 domain-containing protein [Planctomycetaceae bacterium]
MSSLLLGTDTLTNSVTSITQTGFWFLYEDREYFVPFSDYPIFKSCPVDTIFNPEFIAPNQVRWSEIDVDIEMDALENPSHFPLQYH